MAYVVRLEWIRMSKRDGLVPDPNNPVRLGGDPLKPAPFVDPRVSDPAAVKYAQSAEARRRNAPAIPRYTDPVAGGPDLPIPRLDSEAISGMSMADQARLQRGELTAGGMPMPQMAGLAPASSSIVEGVAHQQPLPPPPRSEGLIPPSGLRPTDLLPEQATKDAAFQQGQGAMFAVNQPALAHKYGVMRNGEFVAPQRLRNQAPQPRGAAPAGGLRPETVEGLKALEQLQTQRAQVEAGSPDRAVEEEARRGPAGGAGITEKPLSETDKKQLLDDMDEFDLSRLKSALFKDLLNNDEQKKIIEDRLPPLDLTSLIMDGRVTQVVPIQPGQFEPEFQSYSVGEDLIIKRLIGEEAETLKPSDRYLLDKFTLMGLTISVKAVNKRQLPGYTDASGLFDDAAFWKKYDIISRWNFHMIASLTVNWFWFDMRVRKLFKAEALGNG